MSPGSGAALARYGAPAAFLLAATIAILLVRAATSTRKRPRRRAANVPRTTSTVASADSARDDRPGNDRPRDAEFYEIEAGDTLDPSPTVTTPPSSGCSC